MIQSALNKIGTGKLVARSTGKLELPPFLTVLLMTSRERREHSRYRRGITDMYVSGLVVILMVIGLAVATKDQLDEINKNRPPKPAPHYHLIP